VRSTRSKALAAHLWTGRSYDVTFHGSLSDKRSYHVSLWQRGRIANLIVLRGDNRHIMREHDQSAITVRRLTKRRRAPVAPNPNRASFPLCTRYVALSHACGREILSFLVHVARTIELCAWRLDDEQTNKQTTDSKMGKIIVVRHEPTSATLISNAETLEHWKCSWT